MDASGRVLFRKRVSRSGVVLLVRKHAGCVVAMEACCGAHHLGRVFAEAGHEVRLMSPEYVLPYVKAQKNDDRDAVAIAEAAMRPTMRFEKTVVNRTTGANPATEATPGDTLRYTLRVENLSDVELTGFSLRDELDRLNATAAFAGLKVGRKVAMYPATPLDEPVMVPPFMPWPRA